ncbi:MULTISPECIES: DUF2550 domain-containing protein [unclassified Spirillospora]|uniref:DUF2550 domain-containing protein n=1 Tax=unclassified Spirillospora TaxID=2642701 RepID=UPI0037196B1D
MGEHLALEAGGVLAVLILVAALLYVSMRVRRRLFARGGGTLECSLRELPREGGAPGVWRLGIGRYRGDALHWHRVFEFRSRPRQVIHRRGLVVSNRRDPDPEEAEGLLPDATVIEVRDGGVTLELAMGAAALTGFLAWLEAAPPGLPVNLRSPE